MDLRLKPRRKLSRITRRLLSSVAETFPSNVFGSGVEGLMLDPSDLTTLFQNTAGTQPVTTAGQTVALALDKSKGLVLGPELVTNGDFLPGTSGWSATGSATLSVVSGRLRVENRTTITAGTTQLINTVAGRTYLWSYFVDPATSGGAVIRVRDGSTLTVISTANRTAAGTFSLYFVATSSTTQINCINSSSTIGAFLEVDNISVRELSGNHATQSILASRPTYGVVPATGRRNLLTRTEEFNDADWLKFDASAVDNAAVAPDGATTADKFREGTGASIHRFNQAGTIVSGQAYMLSVYAKASERTRVMLRTNNGSVDADTVFDLSAGTVVSGTGVITDVGMGWYRVSRTFTAASSTTSNFISQLLLVNTGTNTSYTGDGTSGIFIWGAQLETGSTPTAYQRVVSAFDVTEAGVQSLSYLSFDGIDDFLVTPTITPNTDKVQVFAGVRKLSDAAAGTLVDFGNLGTGSAMIRAPTAALSGYQFFSVGTVSANPLVGDYPAPTTNVLTGIGDISGDLATLRVNGTQAAQSTADQGTGNYSAAPIYIGRRGGTSLPFNGRLYGLVVRFGPNLDAATIAATEAWMNTRTGAY